MLSRKTTYLILAIAAAGIVLSGCGRKGDLERPGASTDMNRKTPAGQKEKKLLFRNGLSFSIPFSKH